MSPREMHLFKSKLMLDGGVKISHPNIFEVYIDPFECFEAAGHEWLLDRTV